MWLLMLKIPIPAPTSGQFLYKDRANRYRVHQSNVIAKLHEIEEKVYKLESIEATQFLVDALKEVIIRLGGESLLEGREAG